MRQILLYGLVLGLLLLALTYFQYRLLFIRHTESVYTGLVALLCCGVGIWAGRVLTQRYREHTAEQPPAPHPTLPLDAPLPERLQQLGITPREHEVLQLMAQGLSNQQIADHLFVSLNTVKTHSSNLFAKLDAQRRTQAIQKALALGLLGVAQKGDFVESGD